MSNGTSSALTNLSKSATTVISEQPSTRKVDDRTALQMGIMILVLGSSAGMVFYTKRTGSMLQSINKISEQQLHINKTNMNKFGPATKHDAEKMRPRIDKDEFI